MRLRASYQTGCHHFIDAAVDSVVSSVLSRFRPIFRMLNALCFAVFVRWRRMVSRLCSIFPVHGQSAPDSGDQLHGNIPGPKALALPSIVQSPPFIRSISVALSSGFIGKVVDPFADHVDEEHRASGHQDNGMHGKELSSLSNTSVSNLAAL